MLDRGLRVEVLDREQARQLEPGLTERMVGANFYPDDHQVDPVQLARALAAAVARLGGRFRAGLSVTGIELDGGRVRGVRTDDGVVGADAVVIAGGAWSTGIAGLPPLRTRVKPMAGQILQFETRPPLFRHVVYGYSGYLVPRADGRVIMGSTLEDRGFDKAVTAQGLQRITAMALEMVPALANSRLIDNAPLLGAGPAEGLYFATGHYRNGILLTPITGEVIRDLVLGRTPAVDIAEFRP